MISLLDFLSFLAPWATPVFFVSVAVIALTRQFPLSVLHNLSLHLWFIFL